MNLPPRLRLGLLVLAFLLVLMTALRVVFWFSFHGTDSPVPFGTLLKAFFIGFRFDLRLALLLVLPWLVLTRIPALDPERSAWARRFWAGHLALLACGLVFFYSFDFGHYAYLETRLDVSSLRFLLNPLISLQMMWETYPIGWSFLGLVLFRWLVVLLSTPFAVRWPLPTLVLLAATQLVIFGLTAYGTLVEPFRVQISHVEIPSRKLSNASVSQPQKTVIFSPQRRRTSLTRVMSPLLSLTYCTLSSSASRSISSGTMSTPVRPG